MNFPSTRASQRHQPKSKNRRRYEHRRSHRTGCTGQDPTNFWDSNMGPPQNFVAKYWFTTQWTLPSFQPRRRPWVWVKQTNKKSHRHNYGIAQHRDKRQRAMTEQRLLSCVNETNDILEHTYPYAAPPPHTRVISNMTWVCHQKIKFQPFRVDRRNFVSTCGLSIWTRLKETELSLDSEN